VDGTGQLFLVQSAGGKTLKRYDRRTSEPQRTEDVILAALDQACSLREELAKVPEFAL
jgi:hypothetical protein